MAARGRIEALPVLIATVVAGAAGYVTLLIAGVQLSAVDYANLAVFWSALYLVVTALSGIQQETARAVGPLPPESTGSAPSVLRTFTLQAAIGVAVASLIVFAVIGPLVFANDGAALAVPLAIGTGAYVLLAVLSGTVSALALWKLAALITVVDGVLRLVLVAALLLLGADTLPLAWAVVAPMPITAVIAWLVIRGSAVGRFVIDVPLRRLWANVGRTVVGAAAMGVLISGFPFLVGATSNGEEAALIASLIFTITIARAPIVIVVLSLQSYFIVLFQRGVGGRVYLLLIAGIMVAAVAAATLAGLIGPALLAAVFPEAPPISGLVVALIVASGGAVGAMCVTGPMTIARSAHTAYTLGWVVAALTTIALLLLPLETTDRVVLGLICGPLVGLAVHAVALARWPAQP